MSDHALLRYCPDLLAYSRRQTREVRVGNVGIGGGNPIRVQSMITSDTRDTPACVAEVLQLAGAGCEIVRITAQTKVYAANLENIAREVRAAGCGVPLVADIHFKPDAALEAAKWVEKVRVNPGNYADKKKFEIREYSDEQYEEELGRIREEFAPLVELCKSLGRAMRIGTNHGSLSDRIMNRYGDSPLGMCESALEFARIARDMDYHNFVFSMKASNPKVMIEAYRLLVARLDQEGADWNYPIHLGVTEAGDGEDGRIKSAIGIGSLLADGIGDTIRVSLTEDAIHEIPVARALAGPFNARCGWGVPPQSVPEASRLQDIRRVASAIHPDWSQLSRKTSTHLPHWRIPGATYAVTFRLHDSVPDTVQREYRERREILSKRMAQAIEQAGSRDVSKPLMEIRGEMTALHLDIIDGALAKGHGACHLRNPDVASLVSEALQFFDGQRYGLIAWSVMPNHVHAVLKPADGHELEDIVQSWKSFTAKRANGLLGLTGTFWQEEYYDHLIRDTEDFEAQVRYVLENPVKGNSAADWTGSVFGRTWEEVLGARRPENGLGQDAPATPAPAAATLLPSYDPFSYERRKTDTLEVMGHELGGEKPVRVFTSQEKWNAVAHKIGKMGDFKPEIVVEKSGVVAIDPRDEDAFAELNHSPDAKLVTVKDGLDLEVIPAFRMLAFRLDARHPILLKDTLQKGGCGILPQASPDLARDAVATFIHPDRAIQRTRGTNLPHWTQDGGVYAVNFRLADSLPQAAISDYLRERQQLEEMLAAERGRNGDPEDSPILASLAHKLSNLYDSTIGRHLDSGHGECLLRDERIASVLVGALRHFDGERYRLLAWCVMPNHVHLVIQPLGDHTLDDILQSIKAYTARAANKLLGRDGTFWQRESYDHLIRDGEDYRNQIRYVLENPEQAGLSDWAWRGSIYQESGESPDGSRQDAAATLLVAARHIGSLLCDGIGDAILVQGEPAPGQSLRLSYNILQAAGTRIFKTDYVACPSCGRTLFNLQHTTQKIRASTGHLKGVRIAVMGCIVNGPGEMADADFGYVGGAPGKINLYVGKQPVKFNIPEAEAVERLIDLIREHGKWIDAPAGEPAEV